MLASPSSRTQGIRFSSFESLLELIWAAGRNGERLRPPGLEFVPESEGQHRIDHPYHQSTQEGAEDDSQAFRDVTLRLRNVAETFRGHVVHLGLNWTGRASDRFMEWLLPIPNRLDALAEGIDVQAGRIDHRTVTINETVRVPPSGTRPD